MINSQTKFIIIIGDPVGHSLSPLMHNKGYEKLNIQDEFVFLASRTPVEDVGSVTQAMRNMDNFHGLTCTIPHKIEVMKYLDYISDDATKIGAVNTVVKKDGALCGYNTDWHGVIQPFRERGIILKDKKVLVIGAGGASRASIFGFQHEGAKVTISNRTTEKAKSLASEFDCQFISGLSKDTVADFDIIFNSTAVGMAPLDGQSPLPKNTLLKNHIVFDAVYKPKMTTLMQEAEEVGATCIFGYEMLLHQGTKQFEIYTGLTAPVEVMRNLLSV